jgi:hypothetical protein
VPDQQVRERARLGIGERLTGQVRPGQVRPAQPGRDGASTGSVTSSQVIGPGPVTYTEPGSASYRSARPSTSRTSP